MKYYYIIPFYSTSNCKYYFSVLLHLLKYLHNLNFSGDFLVLPSFSYGKSNSWLLLSPFSMQMLFNTIQARTISLSLLYSSYKEVAIFPTKSPLCYHSCPAQAVVEVRLFPTESNSKRFL